MCRSGGDDKSGGERDRQRIVGEMREDMKRVCGVVEHAIVVLTWAVDERARTWRGETYLAGTVLESPIPPYAGAFHTQLDGSPYAG